MNKGKIKKDTTRLLYQACNQHDVRNLLVRANKQTSNSLWIKIKEKVIMIENYRNIVIRRHLEMPFLGVILTTRCSLRCKYCADLIPSYGKSACDFDLDDVICNVENVLAAVDKVHMLVLGGGEVFLYKQLDKAIAWFVEQKKISTVCLITNATVRLSEDIINVLKNPKVIVRVSNYGKVVPGRKKFISNLKQNGVVVEELRRQKWYDIGDMHDRKRTQEELIDTYQKCGMKNCRYIQDGKLWYCARQRGSELGILPPVIKGDYVSISENEVRLRKQIEKMYTKSYVSACNFCDGNSKEQKRVTPGEQMEIERDRVCEL